MIRLLITSVAVALLTAGLALAQSGPRQTIDFGFPDQQRPGATAGLKLQIDYVNPDDPEAKPPAVHVVEEKLAGGTRFDTTVPEQCKASDQELTTRGAAACPEGSRVGGGTVVLDTGFPGGRNAVQNVTQFNNQDELILLFEGESPPTRAVARAPIEGATITATAPPLPGGPPDGYTAIKRVDLVLEQRTKGGRAYITTPATCPADGLWRHEISFTYRDGEQQTVSDTSPCQGRAAGGDRGDPPVQLPPGVAGPPPRDSARPRVRLTGVPGRRCLRRTYRLRVRVRDAADELTVVAKLGGRTLRRTTTSAKLLHVQVPVWRLGRGTYQVRVVARDGSGNSGHASRRYRRC